MSPVRFFDIIQGDGKDRVILSEINIDEIREWISELEKYNSITPIDNFRKLISKIVHGYPDRFVKLTSTEFYRARLLKNGIMFQNVEDFWNPSTDTITEYGRLNTIGESVFYCSVDWETAFVEKQPRIGQGISIMKYKFKNPQDRLSVAELGIPWEQTDYQYVKNFVQTEENMKKFELIHEFLERQFLTEVSKRNIYKYKITSFIGGIYLNSKERNETRIDAIHYPSIKRRTSNIAIHSDAVRELLVPVECMVTKREPEQKQLTILKNSNITDKGDIDWEHPI